MSEVSGGHDELDHQVREIIGTVREAGINGKFLVPVHEDSVGMPVLLDGENLPDWRSSRIEALDVEAETAVVDMPDSPLWDLDAVIARMAEVRIEQIETAANEFVDILNDQITPN